MPSVSGETRRTVAKTHGGASSVPAASAEQEQLPCPRCDSTNTKFCYYNNYNFSQPRHFCKSCRRYWTHGGTLRDIPVGGGSRKTVKRSRTVSAPTADISAVSVSPSSRSLPLSATPVFFSSSTATAAPSNGGIHVATVHDVKGNAFPLCGSFTSLLNNNATVATHGSGGLVGINGFGLGLGSGFDDVGFGLGRAVWPFSTMGDVTACVGSNGGPVTPIQAPWQLEAIENNIGFVAGECFTWPELAISTTGNSLK